MGEVVSQGSSCVIPSLKCAGRCVKKLKCCGEYLTKNSSPTPWEGGGDIRKWKNHNKCFKLFYVLIKLIRAVFGGLPCYAASPEKLFSFLEKTTRVSLADVTLLVGVHKSLSNFWFKGVEDRYIRVGQIVVTKSVPKHAQMTTLYILIGHCTSLLP